MQPVWDPQAAVGIIAADKTHVIMHEDLTEMQPHPVSRSGATQKRD